MGNNTVGSTVKFLCKEGFFRLGRPFTITCQSDGQWTKSDVSCVGKCGKNCSQTTPCFLFIYLLVVNICLFCLFVCVFFVCLFLCLCICLSVYLSVCLFVCLCICLFVPLSVCLSAFWFPYFTVSFIPYLTPLIFLSAVSCGDPGSPVNGKREGWLFQFGNTVNFTCLPGYELEGPKTRTCLANQTWSETQPICKRKIIYLVQF